MVLFSIRILQLCLNLSVEVFISAIIFNFWELLLLFSEVSLCVAAAVPLWMCFLPENNSDVRFPSPCIASLPRWFAVLISWWRFLQIPVSAVCLFFFNY